MHKSTIEAVASMFDAIGNDHAVWARHEEGKMRRKMRQNLSQGQCCGVMQTLLIR
ncbi:hypothetical protein Syun_016999 [Stephania yunnanensis]|uniref:Uncharacterized protein n=1 Tax=Stephania yunnanensis TaxID=152371 RepID=A0AAP0J5S6_9MAGN